VEGKKGGATQGEVLIVDGFLRLGVGVVVCG
jgi:hypothetical protein